MIDAKISFRCPGCDELVSFPGGEAGTIRECPECGGWVDVPELFRQSKDEDALSDESQRQFEENARQLVESARQSAENARLIAESSKANEEWQRQLKQAARYQDQAEETFVRLATLVTRWESLTSQLEKRLSEPKAIDP